MSPDSATCESKYTCPVCRGVTLSYCNAMGVQEYYRQRIIRSPFTDAVAWYNLGYCMLGLVSPSIRYGGFKLSSIQTLQLSMAKLQLPLTNPETRERTYFGSTAKSEAMFATDMYDPNFAGSQSDCIGVMINVVECLRRALKLQPDFAEAWCLLARCLLNFNIPKLHVEVLPDPSLIAEQVLLGHCKDTLEDIGEASETMPGANAASIRQLLYLPAKEIADSYTLPPNVTLVTALDCFVKALESISAHKYDSSHPPATGKTLLFCWAGLAKYMF